MKIAKNIKELRYILQWTQETLALEMNMTQSMVSQYEKGRPLSFWSEKRLMEIAKKHKVKLELN